MKNQLLLIGITAFLFSCSSPMDKKFNEDNVIVMDLRSRRERYQCQPILGYKIQKILNELKMLGE